VTHPFTASPFGHYNLQRFFVAISLIIYPATVITVQNVNGLISGLFALAGIILIAQRHNKDIQPQKDEMLLYFSLSTFFIATLFCTLSGGPQYGSTGKFLHLLLAIPLYIYLRYTRIPLAYLWYGLTIGALISTSLSIYEVWITGQHRAQGSTHPIIFGDLSLAMGCMSIAAIGWFKERGKLQVILPLAAFFGSLLVIALSETRGSWIALPLLLIILAWYMNKHFTLLQKVAISITIIAAITLLYAIPQTNVSYNVDRTITNLSNYAGSEIDSSTRSTSVGTRLEMWQAAWTMFTENPVRGIGWGNYLEQANKQVKQGLRNRSAAYYPHPHNQYLSSLANGGLISFIALLILFTIPLMIFVRQIKHSKSREIHRLALAAILMLVAYMIFGMSEVILERSRPVNFLVFYLTVIMAAIHTQQKSITQKHYKRKHNLSVTIITKDEEDRIEECLKSVSGWADEIILFDSGSTDKTVSIANQYTEHVYETDWPGYGKQKQRALEKATCEWVLSIDADERVTEELRNDIDQVLSSNSPEFSGYKTPWAVILFNHRMDFGRSARAPLRLFKRTEAHFTSSDIHEQIILSNPKKTGKLNGRLLHYTHRDFGHGLIKSASYAWLSSQKYYSENRWGGGLVSATLRAIWTFILIYILRLGMLDGAAGFLSAMNYAQNSFNKYAGLWSLKREARSKRHNSP